MIVMLCLGETCVGKNFAAINHESGQIAAVNLESTSDFRGAYEYDASGYAIAPRTGAYNPANSFSGDGLGKLAGREVRVSERGLDTVRGHLSNPFFEQVPQNAAMIGRLEDALSSGRKVSGADASFYLHEVSEATIMRRTGYNVPSYNAAHSAALQRYNVSDFSVYAPEVINAHPQFFNSAWSNFWKGQ